MQRGRAFCKCVQGVVALVLIVLIGATPALGQTKTWDGGAATISWHDANNWNPDGVPGASDDVLIDVVGTITVTHSTGTNTINSLVCNENLTLSGGTLNINAASTINGAFTLSGGTLGGSGEVTITSSMSWTAGTMSGSSGSGKTTIGSGASMSILAPFQLTLNNRVLENFGTINWSSGLVLQNSSTIHNRLGAFFNAVDSNLMDGGLGTNAFNNQGTFTRSGTGFTGLQTPGSMTFNNLAGGVVNVNGGTLSINVGGSNEGSMSNSSGTTLRFATSYTHNGALNSAGALEFYGGPHNFSGTLIATGTLLVDGTVNFNAAHSIAATSTLTGTLGGSGDITFTGLLNWTGGTMSGSGTTIVAGSGTLDLTASGTRTLSRPMTVNGTANLGNGTLTGTANLTIAGTMNWNGGTMSGSGTTTIASGATLNMTVPGNKQLNRILHNQGVMNWTVSNINMNGGTILNDGVFNANASGDNIQSTGGTNTIINNGLIDRVSGIGTVAIQAGVTPTNHGIVSVRSLDATPRVLSTVSSTDLSGTTLANGTWIVVGNATLMLQGTNAIQTLSGDAQVRLDGTASTFPGINSLTTIGSGASFELAGSRDFAATPTGGTLTNNGTLTLGPDCDLSITGAYAQGAGGILNLDYNASSGAAVAASTGVTVGGALDLDFLGGFNPAVGTSVSLLSTSGGAVSGTFASASIPPHARGPLSQSTLVYSPASVVFSHAYFPGAFIGSSGETWFDSSNWGAGALPTSTTDVLLDVQVLVDQAGALARNVNVLNGGEVVVGNAGGPPGGSLNAAQAITVETGGALTLIANGSVTAASLTVQSGATLSVSPGSSLHLTNLIMQGGSTLDWTGGTITIDTGSWSNPSGATIAVGCDAAAAALVLANGATVSADAIDVCALGETRGVGTLAADVTNAGSVRPGASPGVLDIDGDYEQSAAGTLRVELAALTPPGTGFDVLNVTGTATLAGTLAVTQISPFVAEVGDEFAILTSGGGASGSFASIVGSPGTCGTIFTAAVSAPGVTLEAAYDGALPNCNGNAIPDQCDLLNETSLDCNGNLIPDECDLDAETSLDCNGNDVPDECDIAGGASLDCNVNTVPDSCDIASGVSVDFNGNAIPDDCENFEPGDLNGSGVVNVTDLLLLITLWGLCEPGFACPADIAPPPNGDGTVNVTDLLFLITNWG